MDVRDLNPEILLRVPDWAKALTLLGIASLAAGLFWWFIYVPHQKTVTEMEQRVSTLKVQYQRKEKQVANLPALRDQLDQLENRMDQALERLPDRTEVAGLLLEVTQAGRSEGLTFELFKPGKQKEKEYYAALPVEVEVTGSYNAMGRFLAATASLERIVSMDNLRLTKGRDEQLIMKGQAKTYRYLGAEKE